MKQKKTNLAKRLHMFRSLQDMEKQFVHDVATMGKEFTKIVEENFDPTIPWDQSVMIVILTNMLAYFEVNAELDGMNLESAMKETYEQYLVDYRLQAKEKLLKVKK